MPVMAYPCTNCGALAVPSAACPSCGSIPNDEGRAIIAWLESIPVEQRASDVAAEPEQHWPSTLVRSYPASNQMDATARFNYEAQLLALAGYQPAGQSWGEGGAKIGDFALYGAFAALASGRPGYLTVTFTRSPVAPSARATKRCPDCAEEVLADARICRFCRHEFPEGG
jgi:hypothetical protein